MPTKSGLDDGDLFFGTVPKGAPTLARPDFVVGSGCEPSVGDDMLEPLGDYAAVANPRITIPQQICRVNLLNWHLSTRGKNKSSGCQTLFARKWTKRAADLLEMEGERLRRAEKDCGLDRGNVESFAQ